MDPIESLIEEVRARQAFPAEARKTRIAAGVSQRRMAEALGIDRSTLTLWEAGRQQPRAGHLERWRQLLTQLKREVAA